MKVNCFRLKSNKRSERQWQYLWRGVGRWVSPWIPKSGNVKAFLPAQMSEGLLSLQMTSSLWGCAVLLPVVSGQMNECGFIWCLYKASTYIPNKQTHKQRNKHRRQINKHTHKQIYQTNKQMYKKHTNETNKPHYYTIHQFLPETFCLTEHFLEQQ